MSLSKILKDYDSLIDSLPKRVGETPREVVKDFITSAIKEALEEVLLKKEYIPYPSGYNMAIAEMNENKDIFLNS